MGEGVLGPLGLRCTHVNMETCEGAYPGGRSVQSALTPGVCVQAVYRGMSWPLN